MKLQNLIHVLIGILYIGLWPRAQAVVPPPDGGYPNFTTAEGDHALQALTLGLGTQLSVRFGCFASPPVTSTPLLALERLTLTPGIQTRLLALQRFCLTPWAQKTQPMEQPRWN
jgi:hypothetical protein